jgi:two-component system, NarL family, sensor histidine kinase EvgS
MKRLLIILILFIYPLITLSAVNIDFSDEEKEFIKNTPHIKIGSMNNFVPFSFIKNGKKIGFTQDLINLIAKKSGLQFKKVGGSWSEIYKMFLDSKIDIISELSYRKDRLPFTLYTDPYYEIPIGVFTRTDFASYSGLKSIKNKKIGVIKGSYIIDIFKKDNIDFIEFNNSDERFFALSEKKIDVVITNALNIYKLQDLMITDIKLAGIFIHPDTQKEDLRFGVRKENPILASIINKTLKSIPFSTMSEIKQEWILNLEKPKSFDSLSEKERKWIQNNKISIGIEQAKPYIYFDKNKNKNNGLYNDIVQKVINNTGLEVEYVYSPWSTLLKDFKEGKLDLLPATFYSKDREEFGFFSNEYYKVREYIYVKDKNIKIKNFKDLENKKVAITKGYSTIDKIKMKFPKIKILETNGLDESTSKVLNGEVDALIDYHLVVENYIRDNSIIGLKDIAQESLKPVSVHFLSSIKKPVLKSILQKGLKDISREEMNLILQKWIRTPYNSIKENSLNLKEKLFIEEHKKIRFGIRSNRAPFAFYKDGIAQGIAVDYVKKSAKNMRLQIEFVNEKMSLMDSYKMIESREKFDTLLFTIKNEKNEKRFSMGEAYLSYPMMIIKHKDSAYIGSMKDLVNKTIVLEKDYATNKWIKRDYPNIKIINVETTVDALNYINDGKADAYVGNLAISNYLNTFGELENLKVAAPSGYGNIDFHFVAPKEWPELVTILSKGFKEINSVEHSAIQQKWFSLQTIEKVDYSLAWKIIGIALLIILWILWWNRKITKERNKTNIALKQLEKAKYDLEQKNIEVLESKKFLESVLDETPDPIIIKTYNGQFLLVNNAVAQLFNTTRENMIGKYDSDFDNKKELSIFFKKDFKDVINKGRTEVIYEDFTNPNTNRVKHYLTTKKPFLDEKGNKIILLMANDISDMKDLEKEHLKQQEMLLTQSKIAAMGEMLGNISHQWRQPLSIITTNVSAINVWLEVGKEISEEELKECSLSVMNQANYLSKTIDDFRNFFRSDSSRKQIYKLKDIFIKLDDLTKTSYANNFIKTIIDIDEDIELLINDSIVIQAFINIYNNTRDAFLENNIKSDGRYFFVTVKKDEDNVIITFKDNANGIKEEAIEKIFEPYFTTKHKSIGTGIGLYMTNQIITKHLNGNIEVSNETYTFNQKTYTGAKFIISLPLK